MLIYRLCTAPSTRPSRLCLTIVDNTRRHSQILQKNIINTNGLNSSVEELPLSSPPYTYITPKRGKSLAHTEVTTGPQRAGWPIENYRLTLPRAVDYHTTWDTTYTRTRTDFARQHTNAYDKQLNKLCQRNHRQCNGAMPPVIPINRALRTLVETI